MPNRLPLLAFFLPVLFGQAMGQSADQSHSIELTVQAAPWILTLPREGLFLENQQLKPDGRYGYFVLQDNKNKMTISAFIEPVDKCKSSKECRDMVLKLANPAWENPQNFVTGEIGEVSYFEFFMPTYNGTQVKQQHMYAQFVVDQFWVDLHISKTLYKPDEHKLFVDRVKSIKFDPKKEPMVQSQDSPSEAARKAAEAWLLLWDAGRYDEAYDNVAEEFKKERQRWYVIWYGLRRPLGTMKVRKQISAEPCENQPNCIAVMFETSFEHATHVVESLLVMLDNGKWRVGLYLNNTTPPE